MLLRINDIVEVISGRDRGQRGKILQIDRGDGRVKVEGLNVACEAQVGLTAKGSASAELSAAGQTTVKGAMVLIN